MEAATAAVRGFLSGAHDLEAARAALRLAVQRNPETVPGARSLLDELHGAGRLPDAIYASFVEITGSSPGAVDDATRIKSAPVTSGSNWSHPEQWTDEPRTPIGIGAVVRDRFELESVLGEGGMGVVYRAHDRLQAEMQDRDPYVAIKILSEEFRRHPNALMALQREARKAQTLAHPNIITVHSFDRDGPTVYMTMELLDGETLRSIIASAALDGGLPAARVVPMIRGMAEALAYAHQNDIVHSDFKPGNVFLTRKGTIKVLDFGVARAASVNLQADGDRTVFDVGELGALTPAYASPEMLSGEDPVPADDVFALAIVSYELLTGRHPFDRAAASEPRLREVRATALPGLSRRQRKALMRGFASERRSRQADAGAFLEEFEGPSPLRSFLQIALPAAAVLAAVAVVLLPRGDGALEPDVPFASLSQPLQAEFMSTIADGRTALRFNALNDAFGLFSRAYEIHRNNPEAISGLEATAESFLGSMGVTDLDNQRNTLRLLYCQDYLSTYEPVRAACAERFGELQCDLMVERCSLGD